MRRREVPTEDAVEETTDEAIDEPTVDEAADGRPRQTEGRRGRRADEAPEVSAEELVEDHTKDELLEIADEAGVEVAKSATKAEIAGAIEVATASADELAEAHTKDELLELAEQAGIEVAKSWTKPQIAEAIVASREDD